MKIITTFVTLGIRRCTTTRKGHRRHGGGGGRTRTREGAGHGPGIDISNCRIHNHIRKGDQPQQLGGSIRET